MAPSKRTSNGKSPLVNQQRQITTFFTKKSPSESSSPTGPTPSPSLSKQNPKLNSNFNPSSSPSLITPSPLQTKSKKPTMVIGSDLSSSPSTPVSTKRSCAEELVNKRIRVYWPMDNTWYEGCVISFDRVSEKHLVRYDDDEQELLKLSDEKIEWINEPVKKFRRLRRVSVVDDEEETKTLEDMESGGDDSEDEDWGKSVEEEVVEDEDSLEDMDLEEEDGGSGKSGVSKKVESRKRKLSAGGKSELSANKKSSSGDLKNSASKFSFGANEGELKRSTKHIADSKS